MRNIRYRVRPGGSSPMANDIRQSMEWMVSSGSRYCFCCSLVLILVLLCVMTVGYSALLNIISNYLLRRLSAYCIWNGLKSGSQADVIWIRRT